MASILSNGKSQFIDQNGLPLVGGSVYFYAPGTTNPVPTYQDQAQTILNTNPVQLDSRGQAIVWGTGTYRQIVKDVSGVTIWDQLTAEFSGAAAAISTGLANTADPAQGDALVGVKAPYTGAVARTQHAKNADIVSLADFGSVGDWSGSSGTDNSTAIIAATTASVGVYLPPGKFMFTSSTALAAILNSNMSGPGLLFYNNAGNTVQIGKYLRVGVNNNASNATMPSGGFVVGGEGPGSDGVLMWGQQPSWMQVQTTKPGADTEFQIYTGAFVGQATSVAGTNVINAVYNDFSNANIMVGDVIGYGQTEYLIASKPSNTQLTLTTMAGGAVSFPASARDTFRHCYDYANGICTTNGTACTWVSGDYFFGIFDPFPQNSITISGVKYSAAFNSIQSITLGASAGTQANVAFTQKSYQSNLAVARWQALIGSSEEAFAIYPSTVGDVFVETQFAGTGLYQAIRFRTGPEYDAGFTRDHLNISKDGRIGIGREYVVPSIGFPTQAKVHIWRENTVAPVTDGANDLRMLTLDSQSLGTSPRQLAFGFRNNFNCGYIQGFQNKAGTIAGDIVINPDGGNVRVGGGSTTFSPNTLSVAGIISPAADNTWSFGTATFRVTQLFAATATINTSDEREKTPFTTISDAMLDAWSEVNIGLYQWLDAVDKKGPAAREHIGIAAQSIQRAFEAHGLDATKYGLLCYDEWEQVESNGEIVQQAGNRWGIRADQCLFLEAALMRRELAKLKGV